MDQEILDTLKQNQRILKKIHASNIIRNIILFLFVCVVSVTAYYMVNMVDTAMVQAMQTVQSSQRLIDQVSAELESINIGELNGTITNMEQITQKLQGSIESYQKASEQFSSAVTQVFPFS